MWQSNKVKRAPDENKLGESAGALLYMANTTHFQSERVQSVRL